MATVKSIESKQDDTSGTEGKFYADEMNMIVNTLAEPLRMRPEFDEKEEKALAYALGALSIQKHLGVSGTNDITLTNSELGLSLYTTDTLEKRVFKFTANNNNTDVVTIKIGSTGDVTKSLVHPDGSELEENDLIAGHEYKFKYDENDDVFKLVYLHSDISNNTLALDGITRDKFARTDIITPFLAGIWTNSADNDERIAINSNHITFFSNYTDDDNRKKLIIDELNDGTGFAIRQLDADNNVLGGYRLDDDVATILSRETNLNQDFVVKDNKLIPKTLPEHTVDFTETGAYVGGKQLTSKFGSPVHEGTLTVYVSNDGDDTNSGLTYDQPFLTINEALRRIGTDYLPETLIIALAKDHVFKMPTVRVGGVKDIAIRGAYDTDTGELNDDTTDVVRLELNTYEYSDDSGTYTGITPTLLKISEYFSRQSINFFRVEVLSPAKLNDNEFRVNQRIFKLVLDDNINSYSVGINKELSINFRDSIFFIDEDTDGDVLDESFILDISGTNAFNIKIYFITQYSYFYFARYYAIAGLNVNMHNNVIVSCNYTKLFSSFISKTRASYWGRSNNAINMNLFNNGIPNIKGFPHPDMFSKESSYFGGSHMGWLIKDRVMFQWGRYTSHDDDKEYFNFPTPFPNGKCFNIQISLPRMIIKISDPVSTFSVDRDNDYYDGDQGFYMFCVGTIK